ncbi:MAG: hypothetical protein LBG45_01850 [Dysgonamonadaceae bacterium]|jgi:hypothetical protein|nr:hypothetical protein [Dysgonamonadaceae bacterium]
MENRELKMENKELITKNKNTNPHLVEMHSSVENNAPSPNPHLVEMQHSIQVTSVGARLCLAPAILTG